MNLPSGYIVSLLGQSGCGKTTILRAIAGFEPVRSGEIRVNGHVISSTNIQVPPEKRYIGMTFQDYALFPHLTAEENIGFGLRKLNHSDKTKRIDEMFGLIGLDKLRKNYPHEMSGGQQQRITLARALAPEPNLLLLDEPFSNLDTDLREKIAFEVRDILKKTGHTAILVTHNQFEAFSIADRIGIIFDGKIIQWDTPYNIRNYPANSFVKNFIRPERIFCTNPFI
ncbi:MAG: ABC transporter ATP-binding protein [Bordetella sp.]|nr:MAG: ABC transporter ATP-binding protein [Bordetella sp.]